jgi:hypothetical protein
MKSDRETEPAQNVVSAIMKLFALLLVQRGTGANEASKILTAEYVRPYDQTRGY